MAAKKCAEPARVSVTPNLLCGVVEFLPSPPYNPRPTSPHPFNYSERLAQILLEWPWARVSGEISRKY